MFQPNENNNYHTLQKLTKKNMNRRTVIIYGLLNVLDVLACNDFTQSTYLKKSGIQVVKYLEARNNNTLLAEHISLLYEPADITKVQYLVDPEGFDPERSEPSPPNPTFLPKLLPA